MSSGAHHLRSVLDQDFRPSIDFPEAPRAAVAAIFRQVDGEATETGEAPKLEVLFIQRATKASDPWSGQMAFPGGRTEERDASPRATAMRETSEEIGLELDPAAYVGSLHELDGGRANGRQIIVSAHGYWLDEPQPKVTPNHEVADVVWVPLTQLGDANRYIDYHYPLVGRDFPGIQLDAEGQVVWGLTLRLLSDLFNRLGRPFIIPYDG